jgi:hypothetical protein
MSKIEFELMAWGRSSSAFTLYISERFAYYCGFISRHIDPVITTSGYIEEGGVHIKLHIYLLCGIICLPWHRHSGTRNLGFTSHSNDQEIGVK